MANISTVKKILQVSEEAAPAVQMPIVIGNDIFVLTQQDIRRIEDIRLMSYNRITQNNTLGPSHYFLDHNLMSEGQCCTLQDLISHCQKQKANASQAEEIQTTCPQLPYSSSASPLRYSCSTSTSDLQRFVLKHYKGNQCFTKLKPCHIACQTSSACVSKILGMKTASKSSTECNPIATRIVSLSADSPRKRKYKHMSPTTTALQFDEQNTRYSDHTMNINMEDFSNEQEELECDKERMRKQRISLQSNIGQCKHQ